MPIDKIIIKGAREHNLKNIDLELPRDKFIVFTGISGSGKSTLAFDTIFAESQRRYLESLSSYARQFLGQMEKPDVDYIEGLSPAISIDQKSASHNPRSTVGTVTEIQDYLRLLYAKIGVPYCPNCGMPITKMSIEQMVEKVLDLAEPRLKEVKIQIFSPIVRGKKGEYSTLLKNIYEKGYSKARVNGKIFNLEESEKIKLSRYKAHNIEILIDEIIVNSENISRIFEDFEAALSLSKGIAIVKSAKQREKGNEMTEKYKELYFNQNLSCPKCSYNFPELEPRFFSFNSPYGACPECNGLGTKKEISAKAVMPDETKTIAQGGIMPWSYSQNNYWGALLKAVAEEYRIDAHTPIKNLKEYEKNLLLYGPENGIPLRVKYYSKSSPNIFFIKFNGIVNHLKDRYFKTESDAVRGEVEKYMETKPCSMCKGSRYKKETLFVKICEKNIAEISAMNVNKAVEWFGKLCDDETSSASFLIIKRGIEENKCSQIGGISIPVMLTKKEHLIADKILKEIKNRLGFLKNVGLGYLTLDRTASTLAGGEAQRIRLASQIGSALVGVLYVLDEPSIGLHARDNKKLLDTLIYLKNLGNTLIVIEHDEETMREADFLVDIGPLAGERGGEIVAKGSIEDIIKNKKSITGKYLSGEKKIEIPKKRRSIKNKEFLAVIGASEHNLKNIKAEFPLKTFTLVTGVSGSGKSSLVSDILYKALARKYHRNMEKPGSYKEIKGMDYLDKVINIDQSPIGRTPRSNPATYVGFFTDIRELFAKTKLARARGYGVGRFSFNVSGGRCDNCGGDGFLRIEMQFMPDVYLPCDVCKGKRYNLETLEIKYKNKNISEVLEMPVEEAMVFFADIPQIGDKLKTLNEVGLGYIRLGQAATTLSGGEAQRIKLASELAKRATGKTLYILDEPTTGLHFDDISKLLDVLQRLVDAGNSVIVIEHNMDVIKQADWIIDLGPEGGDEGGWVVACGTPEEVAKYENSYTGKFLNVILNEASPHGRAK
ncbi:MAG: excinuclease ABC subunit UvrA [bacterium]